MGKWQRAKNIKFTFFYIKYIIFFFLSISFSFVMCLVFMRFYTFNRISFFNCKFCDFIRSRHVVAKQIEWTNEQKKTRIILNGYIKILFMLCVFFLFRLESIGKEQGKKISSRHSMHFLQLCVCDSFFSSTINFFVLHWYCWCVCVCFFAAVDWNRNAVLL